MSTFSSEIKDRIAKMVNDKELRQSSSAFMLASTAPKYSYNFSWLGRPIIQYPQDMVAVQEIIWAVKPDLIIETGIAHGGSLILSASILALIDMAEAIEAGVSFDPVKSARKVLGVDIDIRSHNREALEAHPMFSRIHIIEGSSVAFQTIEKIREIAQNHRRILVFLDSNHTHEHVIAELNAYAPLVSVESYCVVFDTIIEDFPGDTYPDRPWGLGNNPKTAVWEYLQTHPEFQIDNTVIDKLLITVAPDGYLKRTS